MTNSVSLSPIVCQRCGDPKPLDRFHKINQTVCKDCLNLQAKQRYHKMKAFHELAGTYTSPSTKTKQCNQCEKTKNISDFKRNVNTLDGYAVICKPCYYKLERMRVLEARHEGTRSRPSAFVRQSRMNYRPSAKARRRECLRVYDLTVEEYTNLLTQQDGRCAACGNPETRLSVSGNVMHLAVDHDHTTGKVRGLLCARCNVALGLLRDSPEYTEGLSKYIREYTI